jgi:hypothetical protein
VTNGLLKLGWSSRIGNMESKHQTLESLHP